MSTIFEQWLSDQQGKPVKRDPAAVIGNWTEVGEKGKEKLITKVPCDILIPKRWAYQDLATVGDTITITCIFTIVMDGVYGVVNQVNRIAIEPDSVSIVKIGGDEYFKFSFSKNGTISSKLDLVVQDVLAYPIFDEILAKGNDPSYLTYEDLCKVLKTAQINAGINLSPSNIILEMIVAAITRDFKNRNQYFRITATTQLSQVEKVPVLIGLRNVQLGTTNFTTRLTGSYFEAGLESGLVNPSTSREGVEDILKS